MSYTPSIFLCCHCIMCLVVSSLCNCAGFCHFGWKWLPGTLKAPPPLPSLLGDCLALFPGTVVRWVGMGGRIHVIVPFIGRKNGTLTARQSAYNDVHGWYRARIEQLFARLWHWGLVRNIWRGGPNELHQSVRILLNFTQFCICRQVCGPPMDHGSMSHLMFGVSGQDTGCRG